MKMLSPDCKIDNDPTHRRDDFTNIEQVYFLHTIQKKHSIHHSHVGIVLQIE